MFKPHYVITPAIVSDLMKIEALKVEIGVLPMTPTVLMGLRETARLQSTHYSTQIEGNRLTQQQVKEVVVQQEKFPGKERDEREVLGYFAALSWLEKQARDKVTITESVIKKLHALVMGAGKLTVPETPYRDGQNVIRDGATGRIVYLPPEAHDVPVLMRDLVVWIRDAHAQGLAIPLIAAIAHYQFATIHPYYDGNGRTARLLATLILHRYGYDLKGIYSLDEYYARNLGAYYSALSVGPHNYYSGRAEEDITQWIAYFCDGIVFSFSKVKDQALFAYKAGEVDQSASLKQLDSQQRKMLTLFKKQDYITTKDIAKLLGVKPRTARMLALRWVQSGFLVIGQAAKKTRTYALARVW